MCSNQSAIQLAIRAGVLLATFSVAGVCVAQQQMYGLELHMVFESEIQIEMRLTGKQVRELIDGRRQASEFEDAMFAEPIDESLSNAERKKLKLELRKTVYDFQRKTYSAVLSDSQLKRLRGLALQKHERLVFANPFYREELGMSDEQYEEYRAQLKRVYGKGNEHSQFVDAMNQELAKAGFGSNSNVEALMRIIDNPRKLDHAIDQMTIEQEENLDVVRREKKKLDEFRKRKLEEMIKAVDPAIFRRWKKMCGEPFVFGLGD